MLTPDRPLKSEYGRAMNQEATTRGKGPIRGALENEERIVGNGVNNAERGNDTTFQQRKKNVSLQRRSGSNLVSSCSSPSPVRLNEAMNQKPMFRSPLDDSWMPPLMKEWGKTDVNASYKLSVTKTLFVVAGATAFGIMTWIFKGKQRGMEFAAGYLVEQSLSIDNLFVFIMLFNYFQVPLEHQGRVLLWGIIGAVVMRGIMIALGVAVVKSFRYMIIVFAGILLASCIKLLQEDDEEQNLGENAIMKLAKTLVGAVGRYDGEKFFTSNIKGKTVATPMLLCLVCIELSDFVFAVDSIPAVLGISQDPFVVYSSNIFAIMSLRSLYSIIAKAVTQLHYLKPAVALVLGFVGIKMILEFFHFDIPTSASLAVVIGLISGGIILSVLKTWWTMRSFGTGKKEEPPNFNNVDVTDLV